MSWQLGPVKPWVRSFAEATAKQFNVTTMYGVGARPETSDHPLGLAVDFMVYGDKAKGDAIANYCQSMAKQIPNDVTYIIWYQRIWSVDRDAEGWRPMEDRGSITANHMDHVHVSFTSTGPKWVPDPGNQSLLGQAKDNINALAKPFEWLADSHNWLRIGLIVGGAILVLFALIKLSGQDPAAAASSIRKVVK